MTSYHRYYLGTCTAQKHLCITPNSPFDKHITLNFMLCMIEIPAPIMIIAIAWWPIPFTLTVASTVIIP